MAFLGEDIAALPVVTTTSVTHAVPIVHPVVDIVHVPTHKKEVISSNSHTTTVHYPVSPYVNPHVVVPAAPFSSTTTVEYPFLNKDNNKQQNKKDSAPVKAGAKSPAKAATPAAPAAPKELKKA